MLNRWILVALAGFGGLLVVFALMTGAQAEAGGVGYPLDEAGFELVANGLDEPVDIAFTGLVSDTRMFVVERDGRIKIVEAGTVLTTPFLNITARVQSSGDEEGLLGLAFAPDYGTSGEFYVYYIIEGGPEAGDIRLARYSVSGDPDAANTAETEVMTIPHPVCANHNGGDLSFGPDGYLYLAPGDGGGSNDNCVNNPAYDNDAQRLNSLLGKMLRIDVTGQVSYSVPAGNPFTQTVNARPEIWAWGLRNAWRFSFDRLTGDLYIGDVGQNQYEEANFQPASSSGGENYGWRCREGQHNHLQCGTAGPYVDPIFEYDHNDGGAITGGYVYRGAEHPALDGYYFVADYVSGRFWAWRGCDSSLTSLGQLLGGANPSTFGEDPQGELYVADLNGGVYRLTGPEAPAPMPIETPIFLPLITNGTC
jgi:glucose/arabinose dehydrogenase